jgi:hypothetical protein
VFGACNRYGRRPGLPRPQVYELPALGAVSGFAVPGRGTGPRSQRSSPRSRRPPACTSPAIPLDATRDQLTIAQAQTALDQQGQHTDRFTKAVDQLDRAGPDHLQARLGGIYALERLARDSPRDHSTIVEVLTAFIRTTAPKPSPQPPTGAPANPDANCPTKGVTADIQAALTVLGRRDQSHDDPTTRIDLRNICLRNADLIGADLTGADYDERTSFIGAVIDEATTGLENALAGW